MQGKRTLDAWFTKRTSPTPAESPAEARTTAAPRRSPATAAATSPSSLVQQDEGRTSRDSPPASEPLRDCTVAFVGWNGAEDEAGDLRAEICSFGGKLVPADAIESLGCTHILVGPAEGGEAPTLAVLSLAGRVGAQLVHAGWVADMRISGDDAPVDGALPTGTHAARDGVGCSGASCSTSLLVPSGVASCGPPAAADPMDQAHDAGYLSDPPPLPDDDNDSLHVLPPVSTRCPPPALCLTCAPLGIHILPPTGTVCHPPGIHALPPTII